MVSSVGIDFHGGCHRAVCLDDRAQPCESFSFQTSPEGLAIFEERVFRDGVSPTIVFEPAGLAWMVVAVYLRARHPNCQLVKAKMQKVAALRRYLRGPVKSDRIDALTLAKMPFIDPEELDENLSTPGQVARSTAPHAPAKKARAGRYPAQGQNRHYRGWISARRAADLG